jgi:hypothetical protein
MRRELRDVALWGLASGLAVGVLFGLAEMIGSAFLRAPVLSPWRAFASTVLGRRALAETPLGAALIVGVIAHFALSAIYGVVFAVANHALGPETRGNASREAAIGLLFGLGLYVLNFQIIVRVIYPWFRMANQPAQVIYHTAFFGLPLALLVASRERRAARLQPAARPT